MRKLQIGIGGGGWMGKVHAMSYRTARSAFGPEPAIPVVATLADVNSDLADAAAREYGIDKAVADWKLIIDDPSIDIVDICTPNDMHFDVAMTAIAAGKHVYCEKPLSHIVEQARQMAQAAKQRGVTTLVGFNYIQNPVHKLGRVAVARGDLGDITYTVTNGFVLDLGTGAVYDIIPYSFFVVLGACGFCYVLLRRLHVGRWIRASGSNLRAAHVSGIDLRAIYLGIFVVSGALTGLAGIILTGYLASAVATQAPNYNLNAIAAVVVGGTSLSGGEGTLLGTVIASWLFAVVNNGLILLGVNSYWQYLATGVILVLALSLGLLGMGGRLWQRPGRAKPA